MTDGLVAFLRACLYKDEQVAKAAAGNGGTWSVGGGYTDSAGVWPDDDPEKYGMPIVYDEGRPTVEQAAHIARHDPARVLAEVAAKRRIIGWAQRHPKTCDDVHPQYDVWHPDGVHGPHDVLRLLALPYAGHDGYRAEWAPDEEENQ